jgi:hypothetical protein
MPTKMSDKNPASCLELAAAAQTTMVQLPARRICTASRAREEVLLLHRWRWRSCLPNEYARPRERATKWVSLREREGRVKRGGVFLFCPPLLFFPDRSVFFSHPTTFHPNSNENSKTFRFPSWKRLHGMRYADEENRWMHVPRSTH